MGGSGMDQLSTAGWLVERLILRIATLRALPKDPGNRQTAGIRRLSRSYKWSLDPG